MNNVTPISTGKRKATPKKPISTKGFGVPDVPGMDFPHQFILTIPSGRKLDDEITVEEDFGSQPGSEGRIAFRASISRRLWNELKNQVQFYLNSRLKSRNLKNSKFTVGQNVVDRLLGREVCVLIWAIEHLDDDPRRASAIYDHWKQYNPEELWWLYQQVARQIDQSNSDPDTGWRLAIKHAFLSSNTESTEKNPGETPVKKPVRGKPSASESTTFDLFTPEH